MTQTYPTPSGARRPRTQLHRRLADMTDAIDLIGQKVGTAPDHSAELAGLEKRVAWLEHQVRHGAVWQDLPQWMTRAMILGVSPTQRRFVVSEAAVAGLRAAGYETIDQIVAETGSHGRSRPEEIWTKWEAAYRADPGSVPEPPPHREIEEFCRICDAILSTS